MITLSKIRSVTINTGERILKVLQYGVKTAIEISPFGDDSSPIDNMSALYAETGENGEPVIIGYINTNQLAAAGEKRIFSLKEDKTLSTFIWLKNDGTMEIGGNADNMVRFSELKTSFDELKTNFNSLVTVYNSHSHSAHGSPTGSQGTSSSANILPAKIDEIKTL